LFDPDPHKEQAMIKLDLKKELKHLYKPVGKWPELVEVPTLQFAMLEGAIEKGKSPGESPGFEANMQALYSISYTLKFMSKQRENEPIDYPVMALEGLWWVEDGDFDITRPDNWRYRLMILQPEHIGPEMFAEAREEVRRKRGSTPELEALRLEPYDEGLCVQMLHIGPYATEMETIEKMHAFAAGQGYEPHGIHHEIYLGDPRRAAPERLKTVLRHPVRKI
jgi:hypothetical protein